MNSIKSKSYLVILLASAAALAVLFWFWQTRQNPKSVFKPSALALHYAGKPDIPIKKIAIRAVYFVPQDAASSSDFWLKPLASALDQTASFYSKQLNGGANISYKIYPQIIVGQQPSSFYDGSSTSLGNPNALLSIRRELEARLFSQTGDLYQQQFSSTDGDQFPVLAVLYEGVGSSGTLPDEGDSHAAPGSADSLSAMMVARVFLTDDAYQDFGVTFFAHEFGHTIGLADGYDTATGNPSGDDIMGAGRFRPLGYTYLSKENKLSLGLIQ